MNLTEAFGVIADELETNVEFRGLLRERLAASFKLCYTESAIHEPTGFIFCPTQDQVDLISDNAAEDVLDIIYELSLGDEDEED